MICTYTPQSNKCYINCVCTLLCVLCTNLQSCGVKKVALQFICYIHVVILCKKNGCVINQNPNCCMYVRMYCMYVCMYCTMYWDRCLAVNGLCVGSPTTQSLWANTSVDWWPKYCIIGSTYLRSPTHIISESCLSPWVCVGSPANWSLHEKTLSGQVNSSHAVSIINVVGSSH